jgi:hypothetical protein
MTRTAKVAVGGTILGVILLASTIDDPLPVESDLTCIPIVPHVDYITDADLAMLDDADYVGGNPGKWVSVITYEDGSAEALTIGFAAAEDAAIYTNKECAR